MNKLVNVVIVVGLIALALLFGFQKYGDDIAYSFGYIPKDQLQEVYIKLVEANNDLKDAQESLKRHSGDYQKLIDANAAALKAAQELEAAKATLSEWQDMQCKGPYGDVVVWNDLINKYATYFPAPGIYNTNEMTDFHFKAVQTQWASREAFDPYAEMDTVLIDDLYPYVMAVNITKNCVILGPDFVP